MFRSQRLHFLLIAWLFVFALLPLGLTTLADDATAGAVSFDTAKTGYSLATIRKVNASKIDAPEIDAANIDATSVITTPSPCQASTQSRITASSEVHERPQPRLLDFP